MRPDPSGTRPDGVAAAAPPAVPRPAAAAPLLVVCALGAERWALRGGDWTAGRPAGDGVPAPGAVVAATGMGPDRARRVVTALLEAGGAYGAVVATGFCAAAAPGTRPGDAFVAEEVRDGEGTAIEVPSSALLADALRARGLTVRTGVLHSADGVVHGAAARRALHEAGAAAVDMETAAVLDAVRRAAPGLPYATVRIVVDTPRHELLRPGTLTGGLRAWRALRSAVPALTAWHRTAPTDTPPLRTLPQEAS
ncbi:1-hydroxy-2-methyl-2-butenyl 4-diphosphate reductase [Streptacidiphilus sp. ASG 303]|uniref:5'-methylthioadenosine/S-adenosylhomocysteine nucleosidase family protein n=1 Tax=Streptacidiphilus sp. ASG 303 TaxID=2896847 RepID=UPI001E3A1692|nr:1-hydroxy-2-methyl-2-butenyl 4-diphosphate reductase [Streptacidiphilus sp. ASG 303]MCD0485967.1 1-hydroxy-2-methyl-2-butenyl 4-diphosphate reductase [Streptacidiphilus sp. ASG 303]